MQLPVGAIAGAAVGGSSAVILIALVIAVAAFVAVRRGRKLSNPNQAHVHNPTKKGMEALSTYRISKQTNDAPNEDMQAVTSIEPTTDDTNFNVNMD